MAGTEIVSTEHFELAQRQARAYAGSLLVPDNLRGSMENCLVAMMLADEMGESRLAVMQNIYFVHGRAAWITAYMVARANRLGKFKGPIRWKTVTPPPNVAVECYADLAGVDKDPRVSIRIDLQTAIDNGWTTFKDSKDGYKVKTHPRWATPIMQEQMLRWRTASWMIRLYAPETMMGLPTKEELDDISDREMVDVTPMPPAPKLGDFSPNGADHTDAPVESAEPPQDTDRANLDVVTGRRRRRTKAEMEAARDAEAAALAAAKGFPVVDPNGEIHDFAFPTDAVNFLGGLFAELRGERRGLEALRDDNQEVFNAISTADPEAFQYLVEVYESELATGPATSESPRSTGAVAEPGRQAPPEPTTDPPVQAPAGQRPDYRIEPVYTKSGEIDRAWFVALFLPKLRQSKDQQEFIDRRADNAEATAGYLRTLQPAARIAAMKELDDIEIKMPARQAVFFPPNN